MGDVPLDTAPTLSPADELIMNSSYKRSKDLTAGRISFPKIRWCSLNKKEIHIYLLRN